MLLLGQERKFSSSFSLEDFFRGQPLSAWQRQMCTLGLVCTHAHTVGPVGSARRVVLLTLVPPSELCPSGHPLLGPAFRVLSETLRVRSVLGPACAGEASWSLPRAQGRLRMDGGGILFPTPRAGQQGEDGLMADLGLLLPPLCSRKNLNSGISDLKKSWV